MNIFDCDFIKYEETIKAPARIEINEYGVRSLINSYSIVKDCSWSNAVKTMVDYMHLKCDMPHKVIDDMLNDSGFLKLRRLGSMSLIEIVDKLVRPMLHSYKCIVKIKGHYYALLPDNDTCNFTLKGAWKWPLSIYKARVEGFWVLISNGWSSLVSVIEDRDGFAEPLLEKQSEAERIAKKSIIIENANPINNSTGDCFARALCKAYDCSWHEAIDYIVRTLGYMDPIINNRANVEKVLSSLGFIKYKAILVERKRLNGVQFCEEMTTRYHNGERIIAMVGRNHCVAVVPSDDNGGYRIVDTWDCSNRRIYEYWVLLPSKHGVMSDTECIDHPFFGKGYVIRNVTSGTEKAYVVGFESGDVRTISERWLFDNGYMDK